jgi:flagellar biosynthesis activator protein FlaF
MYKRIYEEIAENTSQKIRNNEVHALNHSIDLMVKADSAGSGTRESIEAVFFVSRLWGVLLEDLASIENSLPIELKAKIISIGIWVLKYVESLRLGKKKDFQPLIDISQIILAGLLAKP